MAFQRPFLISLKRADPSHRWGFGIQGGRDYGEPLRVHTVGEESLAEKFGLHEGDEIIQVGRVNVQDLSLGQAHELLARCGNKIEMFVIREDLLSPRKGTEPSFVKAVVHNPYNSPLSLYSTENIAETLAKQTEVLTEGHVSTEEDEGPENLSFKQKSAVFQLLAEQEKQESAPYNRSTSQSSPVKKPKEAPPPPPKPPSSEPLHNGYGSSHQQVHQDQQRSSNRVEYQTAQKVVSQYQYQQEYPTQYQQSTVQYQQSPGYQTQIRGYQSPGHQSPVNGYHQPSTQYQQTYHQQSYQHNQGYQSPVSKPQHPGYQSPGATTYQQLNQSHNQGYQSPVTRSEHPGYQSPINQQVNQSSYQQTQGYHSPGIKKEHPGYQSPSSAATHQLLNQSSYQQTQGYQSPVTKTEHPGYQSPSASGATYQQLNQSSYQQPQSQQRKTEAQRHPLSQSSTKSQPQQQVRQRDQTQKKVSYQHQEKAPSSPNVTQAEIKVGPPPPPRGTSSKHDPGNMTAVYKQQYEQHLRQVENEQRNLIMNSTYDEIPKAHIIDENRESIFEHTSTSGTPITYKAPPAAPPKPNWPPPPKQTDFYRNQLPDSPTALNNVGSVWPPKKSTVTELPRTGFNPAAVRDQGNGRRCVWPPPCNDENRSGRNTPQSPVTGRRIQWNPSPSPPLSRRHLFSPSQSPSRKKDVQWPPPSPTSLSGNHFSKSSPKFTRRARFDDHVHEHASVNVPQTYRPPPGTQHVEFH